VWLRNSHSELDMRMEKGPLDAILPTLKHCLEQGLLFVLEGIGDTLEAVLEPLFLKQTYKDASDRTLVRIAGHEYEYSEYFSMIVTTAESKPQFGADVFIRMNVINFSVTRKGLEEQLMSFAVRVEKPTLEAKRDQLVREIAEDKIDLLDVEDRFTHARTHTHVHPYTRAHAAQDHPHHVYHGRDAARRRGPRHGAG
jgi:dynein heavy chain